MDVELIEWDDANVLHATGHGVGGRAMSRRSAEPESTKASAGEAELAEQLYAERHDDSAWGAWTAVEPGRLDVTLSVRFSREEIAAVRAAAEAAGMKPTTFIREAALAACSTGLNGGREVRAALESALADLTRAHRLIAPSSPSSPPPADGPSTTRSTAGNDALSPGDGR